MPANRRFDAKRDESEPAIVAALRKAGYMVWRELPVDLLVRRSADPPGVLVALEVKTLTSTGKVKRASRGRREAQEAFILTTGTRVVGTPEQALEALK